jgi:WhiB family transcriptional regulator, redox-sensing transcriptional regulator
MSRERAFVEFSHAQAELEDSGKTLPCRINPDFFFPEDYFEPRCKDLSENVAKMLCASCPLINLCSAYAIAAQEDYGIWGGTNARERREIRLNLSRQK